MLVLAFSTLFVVSAAFKRNGLLGIGKSQFDATSCDGIKGPIKANVPGLIHTDLMNAGVIKVDPYFRFEETNLSWVPQQCWDYKAENIDLDFDSLDNTFLYFENLDTVASVTVNGKTVGNSVSAMRPHTFVIPDGLLKPTGNSISITLDKALEYAQSQAAVYPYSVPETQNYNVWAEPSSRNFIRKTGSDMGWDWGPAYVPMGVIGDAYFFQSTNGKLDGISVSQALASDLSTVTLTVKAYVSSIKVSSTESFSIYVNGGLKLTSTAAMAAGDEATVTVGDIVIDAPALWWPKGYGEPNLYTLEVKYGEQSVIRKIGVRAVELVQAPIFSHEDSKAEVLVDTPNLQMYTVPNAQFYFKINNMPIFMKGANFIPIDSFESRVTQQDRLYVLQAAAAANMNMIRVWGGGRYQTDDFYEMADEMGLMIWQEIMLACALYPRHQTFLDEISKEVRAQAIRLGTHPSIVIWGGNNENEVAMGWFTESNTNRDLYVSDYSKLYGETVYPALTSVLDIYLNTQVAWVDSSPSNGLISWEPYVKLWGHASTEAAGDVHFYNYACDCEDYNSFPKARFISEFGFQTMPSFLGYKPVTLPDDWSIDSELMEYRQRHEGGNAQIQGQISKHFNLPVAECDAERSFDMYLYLTGIQQSRCYETAINRWRQLQSNPSVHTMGILYWQLNDIWQGPSWASMEWGGRWKPLQYAVRRAYAPVAVTFSNVPGAVTAAAAVNDLEVYAINDQLTENALLQVTIELKAWQGGVVATLWKSHVGIRATHSLKFWEASTADILAQNPSCTARSCYIKATTSKVTATGEVVEELYPSYAFFTYIKDAQLDGAPAITLTDFRKVDSRTIEFTVAANATSPFLFLELKDEAVVHSWASAGVYKSNAGWFSDNNFIAEAGVTYKLTYQSFESDMDVITFRRRLQARTLQHAYNCNLDM